MGGHAWLLGACVVAKGSGHAWLGVGAVCGYQGVCVVVGEVWLLGVCMVAREVCVVAGVHAWDMTRYSQ